MNDYESRKSDRIERYRERAERARRQSTARYEAARHVQSFIPFGQPILIGHHSEKRHRRDLERIDNNMRASVAASDKAEYYDRKAAAAESNDAISSDDPEAIAKLREKLAGELAFQERCKAENIILRRAKLSPADPGLYAKLQALELSDWCRKEIATLARVCPYHCKPYCKLPGYLLSNRSANIRRIQQRIASLERSACAETKTATVAGVERVENVDENRIQLIFPGKPADDVRAMLKSWGFRWSRLHGAWQRHLNSAGRCAADAVLAKLAAEGGAA